MSSVLKADHPLLRAQPPGPFNLDDLEALAERMVAEARSRARHILAQAQEQAERLRQQAAEAGHREGYQRAYQEGAARGRQEARAQAAEQFARDQAELLATLHSTLSEFEDRRNQLLAGARDELVRLAVAIARRITKRYAAGDRQVALENLKEVIDRVGQRQVMQIEASPADLESLRRFAASLAEAAERWRHVNLVACAEIEPGGCRIRLPDGRIDASLETQLERIAAALLPGDESP